MRVELKLSCQALFNMSICQFASNNLIRIEQHRTCLTLLPCLFQSYCQKHSLNQKRRDSDDSDDEKLKKKNMTEEERDQAKHLKFAKIECAFWKHVDLGQVSSKVSLDMGMSVWWKM